MRLRQLGHLVALADEGSFARAAAVSHLSQPAFSRSIEALEKTLQARLIDRAYGAVSFTQAGEYVLTHARTLLAGAQNMRDDIHQLQGLEIGSLRLGFGPFAAGALARTALAALIAQHPRLVTHVQMADATTLCERLKRRELDLFIADTRDIEHHSSLTIAPLPHVQVTFFTRPSHPLAQREQTTVTELLNYPVAGPVLPLDVERFFNHYTAHDDQSFFSIVSDDPATLLQLARVANAVILLPDAPAFRDGAEPLVPIHVTKLDTTKMKTKYGVVTLAHRTPSAAMTAYTQSVERTLLKK